MASSGNSPKLQNNERLDLVDLGRHTSDVYAYLESAIGGILGVGAGVLGSYSTAYALVAGSYIATLGAFPLYFCEVETVDAGAKGRTWKGRVLTHIPGGSQVSTIDYTATRAIAAAANVVPTGIPAGTAGARPYFWARPYTVSANTEARVAWDAVAGREVAISPTTRTVTLIEFAIGDKAPDLVNAWVPIGKIVEWIGEGTATLGNPIVMPIAPWDGLSVDAAGNVIGGTFELFESGADTWAEPGGNNSCTSEALIGGSVNAANIWGSGVYPDNVDFGVIRLLYAVRAKIKGLLASDGSAAWWDAPAASLKAINATVAADIAALVALDARVVPLEARPYVHMAGMADFTAGPDTYASRGLSGSNASAYNVASFVRTATGVVNVQCTTALPTGFRIVAVQVTSTAPGAKMICTAAPTGTNFVVYLYDDAGVATDGDFQFTAWAKEN